MRVAIQVNVDKNKNNKKNKPYNLEKAFSKQNVLPWGKRRGLKGVKKGDIVYLCVSKHYADNILYENRIMYKCRVVSDNTYCKDTIDDSVYLYETLTEEEKKERIKGTCFLFEKIQYIKKDELYMKNLKDKGLIKADFIQSSFKDSSNDKIPFFDYLDKIFDEASQEEKEITNLQAEFNSINKESINVPEKYKRDYVKIRIGQGKFRDLLIKKHGCKCDICGVNIKELLIASHIKEYSKCDKNTTEHLDPQNGLLLCANHDKLFDRHFISFKKDGTIKISNKISKSDYAMLSIDENLKIPINIFDDKYMDYHRQKLK